MVEGYKQLYKLLFKLLIIVTFTELFHNYKRKLTS